MAREAKQQRTSGEPDSHLGGNYSYREGQATIQSILKDSELREVTKEDRELIDNVQSARQVASQSEIKRQLRSMILMSQENERNSTLSKQVQSQDTVFDQQVANPRPSSMFMIQEFPQASPDNANKTNSKWPSNQLSPSSGPAHRLSSAAQINDDSGQASAGLKKFGLRRQDHHVKNVLIYDEPNEVKRGILKNVNSEKSLLGSEVEY